MIKRIVAWFKEFWFPVFWFSFVVVGLCFGYKEHIRRNTVDFNKIVEYTLKKEGGYVDDNVDKGGETNFGISKASHPNVNVKNLTKAEAIEIYRKKYWDGTNIDKLQDQRIAQKLFDMSVLMGQKQAVILLQRALLASGRDVLIDGDLGRITVRKTNECKNREGLLWCFIRSSGFPPVNSGFSCLN